MRVIKRIKGKEEYLYLQHSFRENGKVMTKERYLGKTVPENIDEIKKELEKESRKELYRKLERIKKNFQNAWKMLPESVKKRELKEIAIAFTYNTNAIEGSTITLEETREIISDHYSPNKPLNDVRETDSHSRVFLDMLGKKEIVSNIMLLDWHMKIFGESLRDIAGKYRDYNVRVGPHIAPKWKEVTRRMNELIGYINSRKEMNSVELSAIAHYMFEKIHPFGDGNGRVGRLLMNYILWHNGYPMMIIEYKKRKSYYRALERGEVGFVKYFIRRYLSVHKKRYN